MPEGAIAVTVLRCRVCRSLDPGPREFCPACHASDFEASDVPGTGQLVSWTVIRRAPTRFRGLAPYAVVVVALDAGVRVTGRLLGEAAGSRVGTPLRAAAFEGGAYVFKGSEAGENTSEEAGA